MKTNIPIEVEKVNGKTTLVNSEYFGQIANENKKLKLKLEFMAQAYINVCEENYCIGWSEQDTKVANEIIKTMELERVNQRLAAERSKK